MKHSHALDQLTPPPRPYFTWRRAAVSLSITLLLYGLGKAVQYAEDNHLGSSEILSRWLLALVPLAAIYSLAICVGVILMHHHRGVGRCPTPQQGA